MIAALKGLSVEGLLIGILSVALVGSLAGLKIKDIQLQDARAEALANALAVDSLEAIADTARRVANQTRRRLVQTEVERDSLARALDERPVLRVPVEVVVERIVTDTVEAEMASPDSLRFEYADERAEIVAKIDLRDRPVAQFDLEIRPIPLLVGARCGPAGPRGVFPVEITVEATSGVEVRPETGQIDPSVCNPPPAEPETGIWGKLKWAAGGAIAVLGLISIG